MASVKGEYKACNRSCSAALISSNEKSESSATEHLSYHCLCPAGHPQIVVQKLAAVVAVPTSGHRDRIELPTRSRQLIDRLPTHQHQRVARPRRRQPCLSQKLHVALGDQFRRPNSIQHLQRRRVVQSRSLVRIAELQELNRPLDIGQAAAAK